MFDGIYKSIAAALADDMRLNFSRFARRNKGYDFILCADFCIGDRTFPSDSIIVSVMPARPTIQINHKYVSSMCRKDIKNTKKIPDRLTRFFLNGRVYPFCFSMSKNRKIYLTQAELNAQMSLTVDAICERTYGTALEQIRKKGGGIKEKVKRKNISIKTVQDIVILSMICAFIIREVSGHCPGSRFLLAFDRDRITTFLDGFVFDLINFSARYLCLRDGLGKPKEIGILSEKNGDLWTDTYIRIADFLAAPIASLKENEKILPKPKYAQIYKGALRDSSKYSMCFVDIDREGSTLKHLIKSAKIKQH